MSPRSDPVNFVNPFSDKVGDDGGDLDLRLSHDFADIPEIPSNLASWLSGTTEHIKSPSWSKDGDAAMRPPPLSARPRLELNSPSTLKPKPQEKPTAPPTLSPETDDPFADKTTRFSSSYSSYTDSASSRRRSSGASDPVIQALTEQIDDLRYAMRRRDPASFDGRHRIDFRAEHLSEHSESSLAQARAEYGELQRQFDASQQAVGYWQALAQGYRYERERARTDLAYANSALEQSATVVDELGRLLESTAELATTVAPKPPARAKPAPTPKNKGQWVRGGWLAGRRPALAEAEQLFADGAHQAALARADAVVLGPASADADIVAAKLLKAAVLRDAGDVPRALAAAESTVALAHELGQFDVAAAAQFQRARALMPLARWAEASWCLLLASETEELGDECEANRELAESQRLRWSPDDPRRYVPRSFSATAPPPMPGL